MLLPTIDIVLKSETSWASIWLPALVPLIVSLVALGSTVWSTRRSMATMRETERDRHVQEQARAERSWHQERLAESYAEVLARCSAVHDYVSEYVRTHFPVLDSDGLVTPFTEPGDPAVLASDIMRLTRSATDTINVVQTLGAPAVARAADAYLAASYGGMSKFVLFWDDHDETSSIDSTRAEWEVLRERHALKDKRRALVDAIRDDLIPDSIRSRYAEMESADLVDEGDDESEAGKSE